MRYFKVFSFISQTGSRKHWLGQVTFLCVATDLGSDFCARFPMDQVGVSPYSHSHGKKTDCFYKKSCQSYKSSFYD